MDEMQEKVNQEKFLAEIRKSIRGDIEKLRKRIGAGYTEYTPIFAMMTEYLSHAIETSDIDRITLIKKEKK